MIYFGVGFLGLRNISHIHFFREDYKGDFSLGLASLTSYQSPDWLSFNRDCGRNCRPRNDPYSTKRHAEVCVWNLSGGISRWRVFHAWNASGLPLSMAEVAVPPGAEPH